MYGFNREKSKIMSLLHRGEEWPDCKSDSQFTGGSTSPPSPLVTSFGWWPKEWDCGCKQRIWAHSEGRLASPLAIGWRGQPSGWVAGSFTLKAASCWGDSGFWQGCLLGTSWVRWSGHVPPGGGHAVEIISLDWCGNTLMLPGQAIGGY